VFALLTPTLVVALLLMSPSGIVLTAQENPAQLKNPVEPTPESLAEGKRLYGRFCASCHGSNAEGGPGNDLIPAAPDLTDKEWKHGSSDGEIFSVVKNGVPPELNMVPFGDQMKDAEIWNVVNYIRSLARKN
jgi:mono/diheme cytochrome c family protein